jgi:hypothetical protein
VSIALLRPRYHVYLCTQGRVASGRVLGRGFDLPSGSCPPRVRAGEQPCEWFVIPKHPRGPRTPTPNLTNHASRRS